MGNLKMFIREHLKKLLNDNGFVDYKRYDWWDVLPPDYDDYSISYLPYKDKTGIQMCLNVECTKGKSK